MKSINLNMTSVEVKPKSRSLRVNWSRELTHDLLSFDSIDVEEFTKQIIRENRKTIRKSKINKIFI